jgi:hypothetical protein
MYPGDISCRRTACGAALFQWSLNQGLPRISGAKCGEYALACPSELWRGAGGFTCFLNRLAKIA